MLTPQDIQSLGGLLDKGALGETEEPRDAGLPSEYVVDQLDYAYIKDCSDAVELTKLLRVLRCIRFVTDSYSVV